MFNSWHVLCTKPNVEIKVCKRLNSIGIKAFCPTFKFIKMYSDRKKQIEKPLMSRYILVNISEKERHKVFQIPGIIRYLFWLGKPATVKQEEVDLLEKEIEGCLSISNKSSLHIGNDFSVPYGPFSGFNGKILNITNNKLRLELKNIGLFLTINVS